MSDDQNKEDEFPADDASGFDDVEGQAEDVSMDAPLEEGMDEGFEDFGDEDWDSYEDGEQYLDDEGADEGLKARRAAFNKFLIAIGVVAVLGVGVMTMLGSQEEENMGQPQMEKVGETVKVAPSQTVEFHADTKVAPKEAFGVKYGEQPIVVEEEEEKRPGGGLLNNPGMLSEISETASMQQDEAGFDPAPELVQNAPPMPPPIMQTGSQGDEAEELIPMPTSSSSASSGGDMHSATKNTMSADLPKAHDIVLNNSEKNADDENVLGEDTGQKANPFYDLSSEEDSLSSALNQDNGASEFTSDTSGVRSASVTTPSGSVEQKIDMLFSKLDDGFAQIEYLQGSVEKMESRLAALERAPKSRASSTSSKSKKSTRVSKPKSVKVDTSNSNTSSQWVLKSAQPGQALVSRKGESEMVRISVGESLSGVGKVTAIQLKEGRWVVQGTKSSITQ